jgi:hypothetical protein
MTGYIVDGFSDPDRRLLMIMVAAFVQSKGGDPVQADEMFALLDNPDLEFVGSASDAWLRFNSAWHSIQPLGVPFNA